MSRREVVKRHIEPETTYVWNTGQENAHLTKWERFKLGVYDKEKGALLGRTPIMWLKLLTFYVIFFSVLAVLFAICMYGLLLSLSDRHPRYQLDESLIGTNPGLGFRPLPASHEKGSAIIWYVPSDKASVANWTNSLNNFITAYKGPPALQSLRQVCDYDRPPAKDKVCDVDMESEAWKVCRNSSHYGYKSSSPCVFLKLNRIYGWVPEYYNDTNDLPEDMPIHLKNYIKNTTKEQRNNVWVSCHGDGPFDNENVGDIEMYPQPGFPGYFYPYLNQPGYLNPLVAVHFKRPALHRLISVECRLWAKNTLYLKSFSETSDGAVHFELLLD